MDTLTIVLLIMSLLSFIAWGISNFFALKFARELAQLAVKGLLITDIEEDKKTTIRGIAIIKKMIKCEIVDLACVLNMAISFTIMDANIAAIICCLSSLLSIKNLKKSKKILYKTQDYLKLLES